MCVGGSSNHGGLDEMIVLLHLNPPVYVFVVNKRRKSFFSTELRIIFQIHQHTSVCYNSRVEIAFSLSTVWLVSDYKQLYPQGSYCYTSLQTQKCVGTRDLHRNCSAFAAHFPLHGEHFPAAMDSQWKLQSTVNTFNSRWTRVYRATNAPSWQELVMFV